jgi:hypothetical protein
MILTYASRPQQSINQQHLLRRSESKNRRPSPPVHIMRILLFGLASIIAASALAADPQVKTFTLTITGGAVAAQQRQIRVEKDDLVRLQLSSDTPGALHLHGYQLEATLKPGTPSQLSFHAYATGRYPFEWHGAKDAGKNRAHHGPPLATLEVRPK